MGDVIQLKNALPQELNLSDQEIASANALAEKLFDEVLERAAKANLDPAAVGYGMWISLARLLAQSGWTADELVKDLNYIDEANDAD